MSQDLMDAYILFFGMALLIISPLLIYKIFFKKMVEHTMGNSRNYLFNDREQEAFISFFQSSGFTICEEEHLFTARQAGLTSTLKESVIALFSESSEGEKSYVGVDCFQTSRADYYEMFFSQDLKLVGGGSESERGSVETLPSVVLYPSGSSFGFDEEGAPEDQRSAAERFADSVVFRAHTATADLDGLFDDRELQAAVLDAFDRGVSEIRIQHDGHGVLFRYARFDYDTWDAGQLDGLLAGLQAIVGRLPLAERVEYPKKEDAPMKWVVYFLILSGLPVLFTDELFEAEPLQPMLYLLIPLPVLIPVVIAMIVTWPRNYYFKGTAISIISLCLLFSVTLANNIHLIKRQTPNQ